MPRVKFMTASLAVLSLAAALLLSPSFGGATAEAPRAAGAGYSAEVSIAPVSGSAGAYQCRAKVQDIKGGEVVFAPRLSFMQGEPARSESTGPSGREKFVFEVSVANGVATYTLEVLRGEAVLSRHKASVALQAG